MPIGAAIGTAVAGIGGGVASYFGASKAADAQKAAAAQANQTIQGFYNTGKDALQPWLTAGSNIPSVLSMLTGSGPGGNPLTAPLTAPFQPTIEQLSKTPGYQFTLDQGLKATQNSYASKGLGSSGPAMKGAADYAEGLAGTTYQQNFNNYWANNQNLYNMLMGQSNQSLDASKALLSAGQGYGNSMSNNIVGAGNAQAASDIAGFNAIGTGLNSVAGGVNQYFGYNLLQQLLNKNTNGTGAAPAPALTMGGGGGSPYWMSNLSYPAGGAPQW